MKRLPLEEAIRQAEDTLIRAARPCAKCGTLYVGGRLGNVFCSTNCARAKAQQAYRERQKVAT